jgi:plasmid stability protein
MTKLILNNLDPKLFESLKLRAAKHNRSPENELKAILQEVIATEQAAQAGKMVAFRAKVDQMRQTLTAQNQSDSALLVREDRDQ